MNESVDDEFDVRSSSGRGHPVVSAEWRVQRLSPSSTTMIRPTRHSGTSTDRPAADLAVSTSVSSSKYHDVSDDDDDVAVDLTSSASCDTASPPMQRPVMDVSPGCGDAGKEASENGPTIRDVVVRPSRSHHPNSSVDTTSELCVVCHCMSPAISNYRHN